MKKKQSDAMLGKDQSEEMMEYLAQGFLTLRNSDECIRFLKDLCTDSELQEMARRLQVARLLNERYIYSEITEQTGLSAATISRIKRSLRRGNLGFITVVSRMACKNEWM